MAEGRMLKKAISTSRRLADLKTDSARMLYTWIIPHLDVEGRFYADPSMIKGSVVPRIKSFTEEKIEECLLDMADVGLINLYRVDGDKYLNLRKFEDHQNIKKEREAPSKIPAPGKEIQENSRPTPDQLQTNSGVNQEQVQNSTAQDKIRKDKLREANAREGKNLLPVDNSKKEALIKKEPDTLLSDLKEIIEDIGSKITEPRKQREVMLFIESNIKTKNHAAMMCCIKSLQKQLQNGIKIEAPKQYLEAALKIEDGKHNARDYERDATEKKGPPTRQGMAAMSQIMAGMGRPSP